MYLVGPFSKLVGGSLRDEKESSLDCPRNIRWARLSLHPQRHNPIYKGNGQTERRGLGRAGAN